ncbi:protein YIF1B-like isoform X3 [Petromyzon marinus]|uniref:protein YIF1B-like isoform X3 n=1 Tax=Petromyzon marinus TaxID=7757 RepID=UPI003F70DEF8
MDNRSQPLTHDRLAADEHEDANSDADRGTTVPHVPADHEQLRKRRQDDAAGREEDQELWSDPLADMALKYGSNLAVRSREAMDRGISKYFPIDKLKCYFAVDTVYVQNKLKVLLCPYTHKNWDLRFQKGEPVAPKFDVNAPDLYIPTMAFLTYVLEAGLVYGTQDRFCPDVLWTRTNMALTWLLVEVLLITLGLYLAALRVPMDIPEIVAYAGYKIVLSVLAGLLLGRCGYYVALLWNSCAFILFMMYVVLLARWPVTQCACLHCFKHPDDEAEDPAGHGRGGQGAERLRRPPAHVPHRGHRGRAASAHALAVLRPGLVSVKSFDYRATQGSFLARE